MLFERATHRGLTAAAVLVAVLGRVPLASAASAEDRAAARQHYKQAQDLKKKGQLAESCQHLEEVERLDPKLPTLLELAECTEQLGKVVEAQAFWALARDRAKHDEKPQSRARAESRLAAVQKRVAHLTLQLAPAAGAQVLCDDVVVEPAALSAALPLNPGDHVVVVKLAGHEDAKYAVKLADGANQTLPIAPGPTAGSRAAPPPAPSPAPAPSASAPAPSLPPAGPAAASEPPAQAPASTSWWSGERKAGVVIGAVGLAALGGGSALYFVTKGDKKRQDSLVDSRLALSAVSVVSGGVLLLSGVVILAGASSAPPAEHARLKLTPTLLVARNATVLGAAGEF